MKSKLGIVAIALIFLVGIGVMSYPFVSSMINNANLRSNFVKYNDGVAKIEKKDYTSILKKAKKYNKNLLENTAVITDPFDNKAFTANSRMYKSCLNVKKSGEMAYVEIPCIDVVLPIYHGTSSKVLSKGAGHLPNTSLPIGGKSTHTVIAAHSGYPGETFFDYLTDMKKGDVFYIHTLDKVLKYQVDQIKVVLPEETSDLQIVNGKDYATLLTCTPYGINTHRLLVRGVRVSYTPKEETKDIKKVSNGSVDYFFVNGYKVPYWLAITVVAVFVLIVGLVVFLLIRKNKRKAQKEKTITKKISNNKGDDL